MMKPYKDYIDSKVEWIQNIPSNWGITKIKRIARRGYKTFVDGDWIESEFITNIGIRLIQTGGIKVGYYNDQGYRYISNKTFDELNCTEVFPNDVLICRLAAPVGRACLAPSNGERMVTAVDNCILKPSEEYDERFIVYFLSSFNYLDYLDNISRGSTRDRISRSLLGSLPFPIVEYIEQKKIAEFLDHKTALIDKFISNRKKQIELLEEKKAAIINKAVTKGINPNVKLKPSSVDWIGEIPEHWEVWKLKFVSRITTGGRNTENREEDGLYPFYVRADTVERINSYSFDGEAILTAGDGVGVARVFHYVNGKFDFHQRVYKISNFNRVLGKFLYFYMIDNFAKEVIKLSAKTTVDSLRLPMLSNFPIAHPDETEQKVILEYIEIESSQIETLITKYQKQIDLIQEYKTALISKAVTGKIDVREWQKPINSILNKTEKL